jgi:hypothetical protein
MNEKRSRKRKEPPRRVGAHRLSIRSERRDPVDTLKLSRALLHIIEAQAEAEAQAAHEANSKGQDTPKEAA